MEGSSSNSSAQGEKDSSLLPRRSRRLRNEPLANPLTTPPPQQQAALSRARRKKPTKTSDFSGDKTATTATTAQEEVIAEDDTCPICQQLFLRPVLTRCNHTLCEPCMAQWADVSVTSQMKIVDVDEEEAADFNAVSGLEARCPMCRTQTSATIDLQRTEQLSMQYPHTYAERQMEDARDNNNNNDNNENRAGGGGGSTIQTLTVYIGNRHTQIKPDIKGNPNEHEWTFFVKPSRTDIIEEIHIHLHPTFNPDRIIRARPPYSVQRWGWGQFTVTAYVMLKAGYSWVSEDAEDSPDGAKKGMLPLLWTLDFTSFGGKGSMGRCRLKVKNDRGWWGEDDRSDGVVVAVEEAEERRVDEAVRRRMVRDYDRDGRYVPDDEEEEDD